MFLFFFSYFIFIVAYIYLLFQVILALKNDFLNDLMNIFLTFSLRQTCYRIVALNVQNLKVSTLSPHLIKLIKTTTNKASQTCQDEFGLLKVLNTEDKKNEKY